MSQNAEILFANPLLRGNRVALALMAMSTDWLESAKSRLAQFMALPGQNLDVVLILIDMKTIDDRARLVSFLSENRTSKLLSIWHRKQNIKVG